MSRRCFVAVGLVAMAFLAACELAPLPPQATSEPGGPTMPSAVPHTATPVPWPAERFVFSHLDKVWVAEGGPPYILTTGTAPALSPDGQQVAYLLPLSPTSPLNQVYVLDIPTGQIFLVSGPPAIYGPPAWSPDGRALAYTSGSVLVVTDPRGQVQQALATDVGTIGGAALPAWSADGQTIVCPLSRLGAPELAALHLADGQMVQLTYTGGYPASGPLAVTTRDTSVVAGDQVLYVNESDGGTLWAADLAGGRRQRIVPALDHIVGPMRLSPEGGRLAGLRQAPAGAALSLWVVDLDDGRLYQAATLAEVPDLLRWDMAGRTLYWISQGALYRYSLAYGEGRPLATLPPATPLPTATPLPVPQRLIYFLGGAFYEAEAYAFPERLKEVPASQAVAEGYALSRGAVVYASGPSLYYLQLVGGVARQIYTFQQEGLVRIDLAWSIQGRALVYAATYEDPEAALGRRVDLGILRFKAGSLEIAEVRLFTALTDRSGAVPLLYDEERGEAAILPWGGTAAFNRLDVYHVDSGVVARLLPVEGEDWAALSPDWRWAAAADYDGAAGHGLIRFYDLTASEAVSRTFILPQGTFVGGPPRFSPDGQYLAFVMQQGSPQAGAVRALGIWVVRAESLEAVRAVAVEDAALYLVGWSGP